MTTALRQCFAWWSLTLGREIEPARFLADAARAGAEGVEMLPEPLWPAARDAGLSLVTIGGHELEVGFNNPANHGACAEKVRRAIAKAAEGGVASVIVFAGNRYGADDETAVAATAEGLAPLAEEAAAAAVTLLLELLNSKVDHPGFQCDRTWWGAEVVRRVGSPSLRLLFDAYHMQLMEGDLPGTIRGNLGAIGHVHTGGAPGRGDLDDRQEVNWRAIGGLLRDLGYQGWVGHEFIPRGDPIKALAHAVRQFSPQGPAA